MNPFLFVIITLSALLSMLRDYGNFCALWQQKEYRTDRMMDFFRSKLGRKYFLSFPFLRGVAALGLFLLLPKTLEYLLPLTAFFVVLDTGLLALDIFEHKVKRPKPTPKALIIIAVSVILEIVLLYQFHFGALLVLFVFRFKILSAIVAIASIPTKKARAKKIFQATEKMKGYANLTVIGITGSYGKSSTKEILTHLLSGSKRVIKTPENINSEIGVAQFVLDTDFSATDIFVCEMGAYKVGEIKQIAHMVRPQIGIITTIAEEHLALFGSLENIAKAKYELFDALPTDGLAITNSDVEQCTKNLGKLVVKNVQLFGANSDKKPSALVSNMLVAGSGSHAHISIGGEERELRIPLPGAHVALNIAPALLVGTYLGIPLDTLISRITTLPKKMHGGLKIYTVGKAKIIDDTYNSNPDGFKSAIDTLVAQESLKKFIVTRGMLELGEESEKRHEEIGEYIAEKKIDETIIISPDSADDMIRGAGEAKVITVYHHHALLEKIKAYTERDAAILLENRMPENVRAWIAKHKK